MTGHNAIFHTNPIQNLFIGAVGGALDVCIQQPLVTVKNALQDKRPIPTSPRLFYRGTVINAGSIAPITALQFAINGILRGLLSKYALLVFVLFLGFRFDKSDVARWHL